MSVTLVFFDVCMNYFKPLFILISSGYLVSCGFAPMYGSKDALSPGFVVTSLQKIDVRPIADRRGRVLRNQIKEKISAMGSVPSKYDLQVILASRSQDLGVRKDSTTSRSNLILTANIVLWEGNKRLLKDRVRATVSYNILDQQYATIASERNAESRGLSQISEQIRTLLAVYFKRLYLTK
jgi:LPS-assembly lipoprotein